MKISHIVPYFSSVIQSRYARYTAPKVINAYIEAHPVRKLQIGAGANHLPGWLNSTLVFKSSVSMVYLDAIQPFPIPDQTFDYVFSEHQIEHITFQEGQLMLRECFRILKPNGKVRIATPSLENIISLYSGTRTETQQQYLEWLVNRFIPDANGYNPCFAINQSFYGWRHKFIYDRPTLQHALTSAGFTAVQECSPGESVDEHLRDIEQHGKVIKDDIINRFETMVFEATKPA